MCTKCILSSADAKHIVFPALPVFFKAGKGWGEGNVVSRAYRLQGEEGVLPGTYQNLIEAINSNKLCITYGTKAAKVTKNRTFVLLV